MNPPIPGNDISGIRFDEPAPPTVPDHELIRCVGRGAYGEVWLARNVMGTYRAVKVVHRRSFQDDRPFEREYNGLKRFEPVSRSHESQIDILHIGRSDDCFFYVMELADDEVSGQEIDPDKYRPRTLRTVHEGEVQHTADETLEIGLALTTALEHLHNHGLVHRDVKPSNVIFVNGQPKLADIGLVSSVDATRSFVGTEGFVPPEGPGAATADIYSLGKVLYELCTGRDRKDYPELPTALAESADRERLLELNAIIAKACRESPKDRYASAEAMRQDLLLMQSGKSVRQMQKLERQLWFVRRAGAVVTVLAFLVLAGWLYQARQTRIVEEMAAKNLELAKEVRDRLASSRVANGLQLLDAKDASGALVWFAEALPLLAEYPQQELVHRMRIQQTLNQILRPLRLFPHAMSVLSSGFNAGGDRIVTGTQGGQVVVWDLSAGAKVWERDDLPGHVREVTFTPDERFVIASSTTTQGFRTYNLPSPPAADGFVRVLDAMSGQDRIWEFGVSQGLFAEVSCSAVSPDGRWLALATIGSVIRIIDLQEGLEKNVLKGHSQEVACLDFSADGSLLASGSIDRSVRVWRVPSGEPVGVPLKHSAAVLRVFLQDDAKQLVSGSYEGFTAALDTWDVEKSTRLAPTMERDHGFVLGITPGAGARFFGRFGNTSDFRTHVWSFTTHEEVVPPLELPHSGSWAFSPDGKTMALGSDDDLVMLFDLETGKAQETIFRHEWAKSVNFSPDGRTLLTTSTDGCARLFDLTPPPSETQRVELSLDRRHITPRFQNREGYRWMPVPNPDGSTSLLDSRQLVERHRLDMPLNFHMLAAPLTGNQGSSWLHMLQSSDLQSSDAFLLRLFRESDERILIEDLHLSSPVQYAAFTRDDSTVIVQTLDGIIRLWSAAGGQPIRTLTPEEPIGRLVAFHPEGTIVVSHRISAPGDRIGELLSIDIESGRTEVVPRALPFRPKWVAFSTEGRYVSLADWVNPVIILESATWNVVSTTIRHTATLRHVEWSPQREVLLTAGDGGETLLWDPETGTQLFKPLGIPHGAAMRVAQWSPDGRFIITSGQENQVRVWDAATGAAVTSLIHHDGEVWRALIADQDRLITVSESGLVRTWDLRPCRYPAELLRDYAILLSGRRLSNAEALCRLSPEALMSLEQSLRQRTPEFFSWKH